MSHPPPRTSSPARPKTHPFSLPPSARSQGLATVYAINAVLAVLAFLSASERNQSPALWGAKTFAVGAIAYDQLMQIPTPGEAAEKRRREEEAARLRRGRRGRGKSS